MIFIVTKRDSSNNNDFNIQLEYIEYNDGKLWS